MCSAQQPPHNLPIHRRLAGFTQKLRLRTRKCSGPLGQKSAAQSATPALPAAGSIVLLGATSDIGGELVQRLCPGRDVVLAARRVDAARQVGERLRAAGAQSITVDTFDALDPDTVLNVIDRAATAGPIACIIVAFGILGSQEQADLDPRHAVTITTVDYTSQVAALLEGARVLQAQPGGGTLVAFSSIAGFRARRANYVYGSGKAGLDALCQGLMDRLHLEASRSTGRVNVVLARPGFVIGSMTEGMTPAPLSSTPDQVAEALLPALARGRNATVWIPGALRVLAYVMACVPRPVWRHMPR